MARLAVALAFVLLMAASAVFAEDAAKAAVAPSPYRAAIMSPFVPLSPAASEELAGAPSSEDGEDPDAASAGTPGATYPPTTGNVLESVAPAPVPSGASSVGVSSVAVAVTAVVAGYFAF